MPVSLRPALTIGCLLALASPLAAAEPAAPNTEPAGSQTDAAPTAGLYPGFHGYSRKVTTDSPQAQEWFNQGIQLLYGYNHDEAIRSFEKAAEIDPSCAMAWWGSAYARGLHITSPRWARSSPGSLTKRPAKHTMHSTTRRRSNGRWWTRSASGTRCRSPRTGHPSIRPMPMRWRRPGTRSPATPMSARCMPSR